MTDQQQAINALRTAGRIIAEYLEPGFRPDADETLTRLIAVLETQELAAALDRMEKGFRLKVVK